VAEQSPKRIRIKWVRSGIGFTWRQKAIVRSLGLTKLNHTVVRPDTPQIRGIVAAVPHMLQIVDEPAAATWRTTAEYTVMPPVGEPTESSAEVSGEPKEQAEDSRNAELEMKASTADAKEESASVDSTPAQAGNE